MLVVSTKYLPELKNLPDDVLSFDDAIRQTMHSAYTHMDVGDKSIPQLVPCSLSFIRGHSESPGIPGSSRTGGPPDEPDNPLNSCKH